MRSVQDSVETLAKSVSHEQRPAVYNEARGNFYFFGPTTVQVAPAQQKPDANALELALWDGVKNATTIAEVQAYLNRFPQGFFAELARARIVALGSVNAERVAAENNLRLAEEARNKEQQRLALEAQKQAQVRLAQEAKQKEQERLMAEQRVKEQEQVAAFNAQKLVDEKAREEAERKLALERVAQELAKQQADEKSAAEQRKLSSQEQVAKEETKAQEQESLGSSDWTRLQLNLLQDLFLKRAKDKDLPNKIGWTFKDCDVCPEMVVIPPGSFQMGSSSSWFSSEKPPENEQPARNVSIKNFAMGRFEVTQKQWRELMGTSPSKFKGNDLPVEQISWRDAQMFLEKLSSKTGHGYRLPSEAEWEYSALAGQQTEYPPVTASAGKLSESMGNVPLTLLAWYSDNSSGQTQPVGTRAANKFGLFDMYGNVEEWTEDCYDSSFKSAPSDGSARNYGICQFKVVRGGSWAKPSKFLRSKHREQVSQEAEDDTLGFRVARDFMK